MPQRDDRSIDEFITYVDSFEPKFSSEIQRGSPDDIKALQRTAAIDKATLEA